jgi:ATP-dependent Zn protease
MSETNSNELDLTGTFSSDELDEILDAAERGVGLPDFATKKGKKVESEEKEFDIFLDNLFYAHLRKACKPFPSVFNKDTPIVAVLIAGSNISRLEMILSDIFPEIEKFGSGVGVIDLHGDTGKMTTVRLRDISRQIDTLKRVFVIVPSAEDIPEVVSLVVDAVIDVSSVDAAILRDVVKRRLGWALSDDDVAVAIKASEIAMSAAFRQGRTFEQAMEILRRSAEKAQKNKEAAGPTLDDLHGLGEAGDWGRELAIDLRDWKNGKIPWGDVERGILLSGPPGTGKTTFAGALARTCGVNVVLTSHARWQAAGHLGDTLKAMRASFDEAKKQAPCILFVDEVDSIGDRDTFSGHWANYAREVVNAFLDCLDGAEGREGVVVVGACNDPSKLDAAAKRPGRLDRHVIIPLPDFEGRKGILEWHLRGDLDGVDLSEIAERTEGESGASLEQLVRQAKRTARRAHRSMELADLTAQFLERKPHSERVRRRMSVHEAAHAVVGIDTGFFRCEWTEIGQWQLEHGAMGGATMFSDIDGVGNGMTTRSYYIAKIVRCLAGMAAEEVILGDRSDGAGGFPGSDLHSATIMAAWFEGSFGFGENLVYLADIDGDVMRMIRTDYELRGRVNRLLDECYTKAREIVTRRRGDIERLAGVLQKQHRVERAEIEEILEKPMLTLVSGTVH